MLFTGLELTLFQLSKGLSRLLLCGGCLGGLRCAPTRATGALSDCKYTHTKLLVDYIVDRLHVSSRDQSIFFLSAEF